MTDNKKPRGSFIQLPPELFKILFNEARKQDTTVQQLLIEAANQYANRLNGEGNK